MTATAKRATRAPTYPETDHMGEGLLQRLIMELLRPLLARILAESGKVATVGADQFIYFREGDTAARIAPDIYVLPGVAPGRRIRSWKIWEEGVVPSFCFEVVSDDVRHDYEEKPVLYAEMGVSELIVFDPDSGVHPGRYRWQVFRKLKGRRGLVRVEVSQADRVRSKALGLWLRQVGEGEATRVLPASGKDGDTLALTPEQREQQERAEKDRERAERDRERAEKDRERAERQRAESEVERLRAELARLRASARSPGKRR